MPRILAVSLAAVLLLAASASAQSPRIWNGAPATAGQYPWTVALVDPTNTDRAFCGGTLIAPTLVLTAAHCTIGTPADEIGVVAGTVDIDPVNSTAHPNYRAVARVSLHPFAEVSDGQLRRDLSLLTLSAPAPASAEPITIGDEADILAGGPVVASGWGLTESSDDTVTLMRHVTMDLVADGDCEDQYDPIYGVGVFSPLDQVCAIRDTDGDTSTEGDIRDTCNGDSGGPLVKATTAGPDPTDPADWELLGATSWGLDCAYVDPDTGELYAGIYARTAGDQLRDYPADAVTGGSDANPAQPEYVSGAAGIDSDGTAVGCFEGTTVWTPDVDQIDYLVRRRLSATSFETVSWSGYYAFDAGDAGDEFVCELHGRSAGAGGYGQAPRSAVVKAPTPAPVPPTVVEVPGPTVTVPGPTVVQSVPVPFPVPQPRVDDTTAPKIAKVSRRCSKQRRCTFTVTATDAAPSAGVASLNASATTIRARSCRKKGRRATCASVTSRELTVRRSGAGKFTVTSPTALPKGTHTLVLVAADGNGNVMARPDRRSFTVR